MLYLRPITTAVVLASAIISREVTAQGASASLTHTVTVTVPPRVKVEVGGSAPNTVKLMGEPHANGLSLSINATQPWSLAIGAPRNSRLQWSRDPLSGFAAIKQGESAVASGNLTPVTTSATVFVRSSDVDGSVTGDDGSGESKAILLTIVAQ